MPKRRKAAVRKGPQTGLELIELERRLNGAHEMLAHKDRLLEQLKHDLDVETDRRKRIEAMLQLFTTFLAGVAKWSI